MCDTNPIGTNVYFSLYLHFVFICSLSERNLKCIFSTYNNSFMSSRTKT